MMQQSLMPTRKWFVAQVTAVGAWLIAAIEAGWELNNSLQILAVGIVVEAVSTWLIPNEQTPGGVPVKVDGERGQTATGYIVLGALLALAVILAIAVL